MSGEIRAGGQPPTEPTSKVVFAIVIVIIAGIVLYFTLGMPGMDHGAPSQGGADMSDMSMAQPDRRSVLPEEFASLLANPSAFVVNVHVPFDGQITGTDAFIAFDTIADHVDRLPPKGEPILVYCRSGNMSAIAASTLTDLGYTNIVELRGGMSAWRESGRSIDVGAATPSDS